MHRHLIRVRYSESDQMGVAHHAAYVPWLEEARIEWLRAHGFSYRQMELDGVLLPVVELRLRYLKAVRFDDEVVMETTARLDGPSRLTLLTTMFHHQDKCLEAQVVLATVDRNSRLMRLPQSIVDAVRAEMESTKPT